MSRNLFIYFLSPFFFAGCTTAAKHEVPAENQAAQESSSELSDQEKLAPENPESDGAVDLEGEPSPQKAHELYLLGAYAQLQPSPSLALAASEKAYELDPNPDTALKYLQTKLLFISSEEGLKLAEKLALLFPQDPALQLMVTEQHIRLGQIAEALDSCKRAYDLAPQNEGVLALLISLYQKENRSKEAIALCEQIIKKNAKSPIAYSLLAQLLIADKKYPQATPVAAKAYELGSENFEAAVIYAYLLLLNGNRKQAVALHEEIFHKGPSEKDLALHVTILGKVFGHYDDILTNYDKLAQSPEGRRSNFNMLRVFVLWQLKKFHQAIDLLQQMRKTEGDSPQTSYLLALSYEKIKEPELALSLFASISEDSEHYLEAQFRIIGMLRDQRKLEEAAAKAQALCDSRLASPEVFSIAAQLLTEMKMPKEAIKIIEKGRSKYPDQVRLLFLRGVYEEKAKDLQKCIATMKEVIQIDSTFSAAYNYLAYLYAQNSGDLNEAQKLSEKALEYKPQDGYYLDTFAWILFKKGKPEDAIAILREVVKIVPNEGVVWEHIGDILLQQNEKEAALEIFKKAIQLDMEDEDRAKLEEKIKTLESAP